MIKLSNNDFNFIESDLISLKLIENFKGDEKVISFYYYDIIINETNEAIGKISIRIGHNYHSYYNGNIGYEIDEKYRGNNYSYLSSKLVLKVAKFHKMKYIYLTTTPSNIASNKIIRKLNAKLIEEVVVPSEYFNYYEGIENHNIYKLKI